MDKEMDDRLLEIDRKEVLRYLGYGREQADGQILALLETVIEELERTARPRHLQREFELELLDACVL